MKNEYSGILSGRKGRSVILGAIAVATVLSQQRPAAAQSCTIPVLHDLNCSSAQTIDNYMQCYGDFYDKNVIPAYTAMAQCTHVKADVGIRGALETASSLVLRDIIKQIGIIQTALNSADAAPNVCTSDLNALDDEVRHFIVDESKADDVDAYRRANYTFSTLERITDVLLTARQRRAVCNGPLQLTKQTLQHLLDFQVNHLDYCELLRQSADYAAVSKIEKLGDYTSLEPNVNYGQYFNLSITINGQCGYIDANGGGPGVTRPNQCTAGTIEYKQTLAHLDGTLGWIVSHREMISTVAFAVGVAAFGPYGVIVGLAAELVISAIDFFAAQAAISDLNDMVARKQQQLKDIVAADTITEAQFSDRMTQLCTPWRDTVDKRYHDALKPLKAQDHIQQITNYYALSDNLNDWYNELFRWATTPGPDGQRFLDTVAAQDLINQQVAFDNQIFQSRASQEIASRKNTLTNIKGTVSLMSCSGLTPGGKNTAKTKLRAGVRNFNRTCSTTMDSLAMVPDQPLAYASGTATSDIVCSYKGFRNGFAKVVISNGDGFSSTMTFKDSTDAVLATVTNVTSDTDFTQVSLPGFACSSDSGLTFGTSADTQLAAGVYPVHIQDNILGLDDAAASSLRTSIQSLDSQLRLKVNTCTQQLGVPVNVPRPVDACGIPVTF